MDIPSKEQRAEWRKKAEDAFMTSVFGDYIPEEFLILLDAVDELERQVEGLKKRLYGDKYE